MTRYRTRLMVAGLAVSMILGMQTAYGGGFSLNPFAGSSSSNNQEVSSQPSEPSTLSKIGTGTKNFFTGVGNTLTFKKTPTKDPMPTQPWIKPAKPEPKPNWFTSIFYREKKNTTREPKDWLKQERPE